MLESGRVEKNLSIPYYFYFQKDHIDVKFSFGKMFRVKFLPITLYLIGITDCCDNKLLLSTYIKEKIDRNVSVCKVSGIVLSCCATTSSSYRGTGTGGATAPSMCLKLGKTLEFSTPNILYFPSPLLCNGVLWSQNQKLNLSTHVKKGWKDIVFRGHP